MDYAEFQARKGMQEGKEVLKPVKDAMKRGKPKY